MSSTTLTNLRTMNADRFRATIGTSANLFLTFGKVTAWANDSLPDTANSSVATEYEVWSNMIGGKKLVSSDVVNVIPRYNWTANTKYIAYDHMNPNLKNGNTAFYVLNSDYNVYKCISNANSSNSTVEPKSVNPGYLTTTSDGYIWKYMFSVSSSDQLRFLSTQWIPVRSITLDDGSLQWQTQFNTIAGEIDSIVITNGGSNYTNASNIIVSVSGDGTDFAAQAVVNTSTNTVSSILITNYGSQYTFANVSLSGGNGTGATARAIISPPGGHGKNPVYELGGAAVMINGVFKNVEDGTFPTTNDYRQAAIIYNPIAYNSSNVFSNSVFIQGYTLKTLGTGDYQQDEIVYQGSSLSTSSFNGKLVSWDSANGLALIINSVGTPTSQSLVGSNTSTSRFVNSVNPPDLTPYTGQIVYVNDFSPIYRAIDQTEDYKIVIKF